MTTTDYRITKCRRVVSGEVFYRVYRVGAVDGLCDRLTLAGARKAVQRYEAADRRRHIVREMAKPDDIPASA